MYEQAATVLIDSVAAGISEFIDESVPLNNVNYYYWVQAVGETGASGKIASGVSTQSPSFIGDEMPGQFRLKGPYPNPFNPKTTLDFEIPVDTYVSLYVYDVLGRRVAALLERELGAGVHRAVWDGRDSQGKLLGSGVYFYCLTAGVHSHRLHGLNRTQKGKMMFIR